MCLTKHREGIQHLEQLITCQVRELDSRPTPCSSSFPMLDTQIHRRSRVLHTGNKGRILRRIKLLISYPAAARHLNRVAHKPTQARRTPPPRYLQPESGRPLWNSPTTLRRLLPPTADTSGLAGRPGISWRCHTPSHNRHSHKYCRTRLEAFQTYKQS